MKNIKRAVAVFVSAIMVMAMLAGCGGTSSTTSTADKLRAALGADQSSSLDRVASEIASGSYSSSNIKAALQNNNYTVASDFTFEDGVATNAVMDIGFNSSLTSATVTIDVICIQKIYGTEQQLLSDAASLEGEVDDIKEYFLEQLEEEGLDNGTVDVYAALVNVNGNGNEWIYALELVITISS